MDENKVCKISDFGLTRDIYEDNAYFKKSKGRGKIFSSKINDKTVNITFFYVSLTDIKQVCGILIY